MTAVKRLFDDFESPPPQPRPRTEHANYADRIMVVNGATEKALETGKETLTYDVNHYFTMRGSQRKSMNTDYRPVDHVATLKGEE